MYPLHNAKEASATNPDSRPLPAGWAEHFDSQRTIWYYVDLNSEPPRVAFVHPCDGTTQPLSAPSLGMGHFPRIRSSQRPTQESINRSRQATVAQQLYPSSISTHQASTSSTLPWVNGVASRSSDDPSVSRRSPSLGLLRSSKPRPMTDHGSQLVLGPDIIPSFTANAFYHHSVGTPPLCIPRTSSAKNGLKTNLRPTLLTSSVLEKDRYPKPCFDTPSSLPPNAHPSSTLNNQNIIQPKPIRPLNGVSLNLQDQVAGDLPLPESVKHVKAKKRVPLKNFGLGARKNPFSKGRTITSGGETKDGRQDIALNSDGDESFVFVEVLELGTT